MDDAAVHLDAVLTVGQPRYNATGTLLEGIQIWSERKPSLTREDVKQRVLEEIRWEVAQGTLYIRSHVDVCDPNLTALRALLEVREEVRDICNLQLVAFPQDGIFGPAAVAADRADFSGTTFAADFLSFSRSSRVISLVSICRTL